MKKFLSTLVIVLCCGTLASAFNNKKSSDLQRQFNSIEYASVSTSIPSNLQGNYYHENDPRYVVYVGGTSVTTSFMGTQTRYEVKNVSGNHIQLIEITGGTLAPTYGSELVSLTIYNDGTLYMPYAMDGVFIRKR